MGREAPSKLSFGLGGYRFKIENGLLKYRTIYGKGFTVRLKDIQTASVDEAGRGKGTLKLVGAGTTLAQITLPRPWAEKVQEFVLQNID